MHPGVWIALLCLLLPVGLVAVLVGALGKDGGSSVGSRASSPGTPVATPSGGREGYWPMDEPPPNIVAADASGNGHYGQLHDVQVGVRGLLNAAYRLNGRTSAVEVPDAAGLNPSDRPFSFSVAFRLSQRPTGAEPFDLMRKGTSDSSGGAYKAEIAVLSGRAVARCTARDSAGTQARATLRRTDVADGLWHILTCTRSSSHWSVQVDGGTTVTPVRLGNISNNEPLTFGAKVHKSNWDGFYPGDLDEAWLQIR